MRQGGYTFKGLLTLIVVFMTGSPALGEQWPPVKPVTQSFEVNLAVGLVAIDLPIRSKDDSVLYRLSCRGGSEKILDELGEHDDVNWVGPLMCVLNPGALRVSEESLLAEDDSPPWHTRGQFNRDELVGACGAYPEFGLYRSFHLRGFVLRLSVRNLELNSDGSVRRFTFVVSVGNDAKARGAYAERPEYMEPVSGKCDVVRKGRDPRYCRTMTGPTTGSWTLCPKQ
jgi:hypothetical protein